MNADGSAQHQLTNTKPSDRDPAWSPDGGRIAFSRDGKIFVMTADGTSLSQLTRTGSVDHSPAWSPDGTHIALVRQTARK